MVLEGHVRRGKKLIPPMLEMRLKQTQWHVERLPELFWLAFVRSRIGDQRTLALAHEMEVQIESTIKELRGDGKAFRAYLPSEHLSCSDTERTEIAAAHSDSVWLHELRLHFADMVAVWPALPFAYLATPGTQRPKSEIVSQVKTLLRECSYRHDKLALIIQAMAVAIEGQAGRLYFAQGLNIPDLNAVFDYPDTEESQHAAGFIVTICGGTMMHRNGMTDPPDFTWQRSFWNSCFKLGPCEYE